MQGKEDTWGEVKKKARTKYPWKTKRDKLESRRLAAHESSSWTIFRQFTFERFASNVCVINRPEAYDVRGPSNE